MIKPLLTLTFSFLALTAFSQHHTVSLVNPASVAPPRGYSHAAVIDLGTCTMIIMSGQVPLDRNGNLVGAGDLSKQTDQVFMNIKNIMMELGGTMDNVIKLSYFLTDASQIQRVRDIRDKYVNIKNPPASTLVEVNKLFRDDVMIEIEATAIMPKK